MASFPTPFGPYVLLKSLGTGGGGDVCLASPQDASRGLPPVVVIKRLHGQLAQQNEWVQRFAHEAEIAVSVDSPNLAKSFDAGRVGDTFYIAMEYIAGWPLSRIIRDLQETKTPSTVRSVATIVAGALSGLSALHTMRHRQTGAPLGTVHRDIAPKNIMVGEDGITRLIDLGIGKSTMQDWKTSTGVVLGSPGYMAPEQVAGLPIDQRVDIYAMGIVLWEFLTLKYYFDRSNLATLLRAQHKPVFTPPSVHADVPRAIDEVCRRALATDREERFSTAQEFLTALQEAASEREEEPQLGTVVRSPLVGELGRDKTEVYALLEAGRRAPVALAPESQGEVVILAARAPGAAPVRVDPAQSYALAGGTHVGVSPFATGPTPMLTPTGYPSGMTPTYGSGPLLAPSYVMMAPRSQAHGMVVLATGAALVVAVVGLILVIRGSANAPPRVEMAPLVEEQPKARASARAQTAEPSSGVVLSTSREAHAREEAPKKGALLQVATEASQESKGTKGESRSESRAEARSESTSESRSEAKREAKDEPKREAKALHLQPNGERSSSEILNAMISRARAVQARSPRDSEPAKAAVRLISVLGLEAGRKELDPSRHKELEAELRALEAQ